jgi:hypothetical protein
LDCTQDEPIDWACRLGHAAAARAILRDPSVFQQIVARKSDAISRCCVEGHAETLKVLLESVHISHTHSNTTIDTFTNLTPLQLAACSKDLKTVELVLEQGVDPNECHAGKRSALGIAASNHSYEICAALLKYGASVKLDSDEVSAFRYLLKKSKDFNSSETAALIHLFLTERPDDKLQNDIVSYLKSYRLYSTVIQKLLSAGAPLNDRTENGFTALHVTVYDAVAVADDFDSAVYRLNMRTLVLAGADLLAKTTAPATAEDLGYAAIASPIPAGLTPMDIARTCGSKRRRDAVVADLTAAIAERAL